MLPDQVIGRDIWSQISDVTVRGIYRMILKRARAGQRVTFQYRCDSSTHRRTFEMVVVSESAEVVRFDSHLVHDEERPPVPFLDEEQARDDRRLIVCSWCQRVALGDGQWIAVEDAVRQMGYLKSATLPLLSHGICPECAAAAFGAFGEPPAEIA